MIFLTVLGWVLAVVAAFLAMRFWARSQAIQSDNAVLRTQLIDNQKRLDEQKQVFENSQGKLEQTFKVLAAETLSQQSENFLKLASERLDRKTVEAKGVLDEKTTIFRKLVEPIEKTLSQVQKEMSDFEKKRIEQFGHISEQLKNVVSSSEGLQKEAKSLSTALRRPEIRGSWGELQLRRVVELAGMLAHCDFDEQVSVKTSKGNVQRPDMVVNLPNGRILAVDSKVILTAYLDSIEAEALEQKQIHRQRHLQNLRATVKDLSQKAYWDQFENSPDFVVLFIPNEAILNAALEEDRTLMEDAWSDNIIIATPTTLIALLKAVAYGWQQNQLAENAQNIIQTAAEFYERLLPWFEHLQKVGAKLGDSVESYNSAMGSLEARVLPSARKLKELGLQDAKTIEASGQVEVIPRKARDQDLIS